MVGATTAPRSGRLHRIDLKSSKRVLSSGDYFYFCNRKNKLVGGMIHILWIDYDPKSILKFLVFWDTERQTGFRGFGLFVLLLFLPLL